MCPDRQMILLVGFIPMILARVVRVRNLKSVVEDMISNKCSTAIYCYHGGMRIRGGFWKSSKSIM